MTTFAELGLSEPLLEALHDVGYQEPSPIQEQAIPHLLQGLDVIGQAQTGSGKTAAFGLPLINYVDPSEHEVQGLVLTPTRRRPPAFARFGAIRSSRSLTATSQT